MSVIPFDPLAYARKLENAGIIREQAEVQAHALHEYMDRQTALMNEILEKYDAASRKESATKSDLLTLKNDLQKEIQDVRTELQKEIQDVRTELQKEIQDVQTELQKEIQDVQINLTSEIAEAKNDMIRWYLSSMVAFAALMLCMFAFFMR